MGKEPWKTSENSPQWNGENYKDIPKHFFEKWIDSVKFIIFLDCRDQPDHNLSWDYPIGLTLDEEFNVSAATVLDEESLDHICNIINTFHKDWREKNFIIHITEIHEGGYRMRQQDGSYIDPSK